MKKISHSTITADNNGTTRSLITVSRLQVAPKIKASDNLN
jgi:hypothetical protein